MKPDWSSVPSGFDWLAQDSTGMWFCFKDEPYLGPYGWMPSKRVRKPELKIVGASPGNSGWEVSLERHP
jgi:hypothetical protein